MSMRKLLIFFALLLLISACLQPQISERELHRQLALARAESDSKIASLKSEVERLRKIESENKLNQDESTRLQNEIERLKNAYTSIEQEKIQLSESVSKLQSLAEDAKRLETEAREARERAEAIERERDQMKNELKKFIDIGDIGVDITPDGIRITMRENILFDSGKSDLKQTSFEMLQKLSELLIKTNAKEIRIAGHTDNVPINSPQFPSNWELSTARALSVLHQLSEKFGVPSSKLVAIGFGEHKPIAGNSTAEGRSKNRRVEIYLVPAK